MRFVQKFDNRQTNEEETWVVNTHRIDCLRIAGCHLFNDKLDAGVQEMELPRNQFFFEAHMVNFFNFIFQRWDWDNIHENDFAYAAFLSGSKLLQCPDRIQYIMKRAVKNRNCLSKEELLWLLSSFATSSFNLESQCEMQNILGDMVTLYVDKFGSAEQRPLWLQMLYDVTNAV